MMTTKPPGKDVASLDSREWPENCEFQFECLSILNSFPTELNPDVLEIALTF